MFYTIYKVTHQKSGKFYIGKHQTNNLEDGYMGSGKRIRRAIKKYGIEEFSKEILFIFVNEDDMNRKEEEIVTKEFCESPNTYNLCEGGKGGWSYVRRNEKHRNKMFKNANTRRKELFPNGTMYGKKLSAASKKLISEKLKGNCHQAWLGRKHTDETKKKMRSSHIGRHNHIGSKNSRYGSMWITNGINSRSIWKIDKIPDGWKRGRIME